MRLIDLKTRLSRPASVMEIGGRPNGSVSLFGAVSLGLPGEVWPSYNGRPMIPILQLDLREAPHVPQILEGIEAIALFFDRVGPEDGAENGEGWLLRAYPRAAELVTLEPPQRLNGAVRPRPIHFRLLAADYPDWDDAADLDVPEALADSWEDHFGAADESKLGGWPKLLQSEIFWAPGNEHPAAPEYAFQLESLPNAGFDFPADSVCYFGRGTEDRNAWAFTWQTL